MAVPRDVGREVQLQRELDETKATARKQHAELSKLRPAMLELELARERIAALEARVAELGSRVAELSAVQPPDDLRKIKGIGPKFEVALRELGICSYAQIASWTAQDVADIAPKIGARPERIERDGWVSKAQELRRP